MNTNTFPSTPMVAALLLALLGSPVGGVPVDDAPCQSRASMASLLMQGRQVGIPLNEAIRRVRERKGDESTTELYESYLIAAYKLPRYQTDRMQTQAAEEFSNAAYLKCYGEMKDAQAKDLKTIEPTKTEDTK